MYGVRSTSCIKFGFGMFPDPEFFAFPIAFDGRMPIFSLEMTLSTVFVVEELDRSLIEGIEWMEGGDVAGG